MKKQFFYFICIIYLLGSCLAEQDNPLIVGSCTDRIKNQNEETVDCGGICGACEVIIPIKAPCADALTDNHISLDDEEININDWNHYCEQKTDNFTITIWQEFRELTIEIPGTSLPLDAMEFELQSYLDQEHASIQFIDFYSYTSTTGKLYVSMKNNKPVFEICSVNLNGSSGSLPISGRVICE
jgi:hypothetical protein